MLKRVIFVLLTPITVTIFVIDVFCEAVYQSYTWFKTGTAETNKANLTSKWLNIFGQ